MRTLLVLGATSGIARATALAFAQDGWNIQLAGRHPADLQVLAQDLSVRCGRAVPCFSFDACAPDSADALLRALPALPDAVLCAVGVLDDQQAARNDMALADRILVCNFTGLVPVLGKLANLFEQRGSGLIVGISSVAGERGRASNYVYGSAKAGFTAFLSGLRNRLAGKGVRVMTVKPGFVVTRMTEDKTLPPLLTASPEEVARDILNGVKKGRDVVYSKWYWGLIMGLTRIMPECVFKRTRF